jgi:hypothetical protein
MYERHVQSMGAEPTQLDGVNKALLKLERFWNSQISFAARPQQHEAA